MIVFVWLPNGTERRTRDGEVAGSKLTHCAVEYTALDKLFQVNCEQKNNARRGGYLCRWSSVAE